ncbi:radical SAM protein [Fimbriimonas ginsengisoli]|uniref:Radical SAM domain protein n=1 Tax=Fimbriimonas ginsengisoli Gsoil 348 TaxID=661478 RepID=A0A068NQH5_FIMGI|nr:CofH family radical SAM protein [Fimbriimonas ginsengisoli]AIE83859.1 Radical SAM domain protein [Fimbriimonas ginsengisoli Gsoil 348]
MALTPDRVLGAELLPLYEKVQNQERLSREDGLLLCTTPNLTGVGYLANIVRERKHGAKTYYVRNQHVNYTNICNKFCKFCSFYAKKGGPAPYQMSLAEVRERLERHRDVPLTEIHMVGGINPRLPYSYYLDLVRTVKEVRPGVHVKAFTAVEIVEIARQGKVTVDQALADLIEAGLDSLPGGGIEILSDRVHSELFGKKLNGEEWKDVARAAAKLGLKQYATMLYGHIETDEERVDHLIQIRELQDETGHFLTMTPLSFHPEATELEHIAGPTGDDDLRNIAVSRLMLDNFDHIKSFWIMNTVPITQMALWYGADDADGLVQEYEITYKAGEFGNKRQYLTAENMIRMIQEAGRIPVERDSLYHEITSDQLESTVRAPRSLTALPMAAV